MNIEQAIQKAIDGGWSEARAYTGFGSESSFVAEIAFLDPSFWQSLGKTMKWTLNQPYQNGDGNWREIPWWQYKWHRYIDHLAEGKLAESFFETLS